MRSFIRARCARCWLAIAKFVTRRAAQCRTSPHSEVGGAATVVWGEVMSIVYLHDALLPRPVVCAASGGEINVGCTPAAGGVFHPDISFMCFPFASCILNLRRYAVGGCCVLRCRMAGRLA